MVQDGAVAAVASRRLSIGAVIGYVLVIAAGLVVGALVGLIAAGLLGLIEIRC